MSAVLFTIRSVRVEEGQVAVGGEVVLGAAPRVGAMIGRHVVLTDEVKPQPTTLTDRLWHVAMALQGSAAADLYRVEVDTHGTLVHISLPAFREMCAESESSVFGTIATVGETGDRRLSAQIDGLELVAYAESHEDLSWAHSPPPPEPEGR